MYFISQLEKNAKLNKNVQPIELPKKEKKINSNLDCLVVGWGRTGRSEPISTVLKEATEKTQLKIECDKIWKENFIAQQMICTKFKRNTGGICQVNDLEALHAVHSDAEKHFKKQNGDLFFFFKNVL